MKKAAFIVGGVLSFWACPGLMVATAMMLDSPRCTRADEIRVEILLCIEALAPLIWLASCVLCIVESRGKGRRPRILLYTAAPYAAVMLALSAFAYGLFY